MLQDVVRRTLGDQHPFIWFGVCASDAVREEGMNGEDVGILPLHARCHVRVFVS